MKFSGTSKIWAAHDRTAFTSRNSGGKFTDPKSPDHHMWQSEIPWKWRFLMGKSSAKMVDFGGLW